MELQATDAALEAFFENSQQQTYKKNSVILRLSPESQDVFMIDEGFVDVCGYGSNGSVMSLHIYKPGEVFPVTSLIEPRMMNIFFTAYTDVVLRKGGKQEFLKYLERTPAASMTIIGQQAYIHDRVMNLHLDTAEQRVVHRLIDMVNRYGVKEGGHYRITLPFTQQQMADAINLSRETTGKILNNLETRGCIVKGRKHTIVYLDKLKKVQQTLE